MIEQISTGLIDWSRAQFAMTAMYHWLFVPLTLGLAMIMGVMETIYVKTGDVFWKQTAKFWMKIFGINFAIGVATGLILEFQFGTNWSNYSWFVGDIFGAPLAIEGILAFFMEATFIAVMFFGWNKVSKGFHLTSTWLTGIGATISAWWILVANTWMQHPVGMEFNPETVRNEMVDFWTVAFQPMAVTKFFHSVLSGWVLGAAFVIGVSCWYLLRKRHQRFATSSIKVASVFGIVAALVVAFTGDRSGYEVAQHQPMKLAALEGLEQGGTGQGLEVVAGIKIPNMLSFLATRTADGYVPGIEDILEGGYTMPDGETALPAEVKMARGRIAIQALADFRQAQESGDAQAASQARAVLDEHMPYFGYGYIEKPADLVPHVDVLFWAFRVMVGLGLYFIAFFVVSWFLNRKGLLSGDKFRWLKILAIVSIPLAMVAGQAGWMVAEMGRQPWAIQDLLPVNAAVSALSPASVKTTFFIFLALFTILLVAEIGIMVKAIRKGPEKVDGLSGKLLSEAMPVAGGPSSGVERDSDNK